MIFTSYYSNIKNIPKEYIKCSISNSTKGIEHLVIQDDRFAPSSDILYEYKNSPEGHEREVHYVQRFKEEILSKNIDIDISKNIVLLCYEHPTDFCHRHIVAEALEEKYNIEVRELNFTNYKRENYRYVLKETLQEDEW